MLSVDDSVLDKPYSDPSVAAFIDWFWSGKHKRTVKGINLVSLFYTDIHGLSVPVNLDLIDSHWGIERFHRAIKQVCNIEHFQVRTENPIRNHIFCAIKAFVRLEFMRLNKQISHWYEVMRDLYVKVIRDYISKTADFDSSVNA